METRTTTPGNALVASIIQYLKKRHFEPGDRLPSERVLAEKLGVGRNALREAFAVLSSLRVVDIRPNSGVYMREISAESSFEQLVLLEELGTPPTATEVIETLEVRDVLEAQAMRLACERRTDDDLAELHRLLEDEKAALRKGENTYRLDHAFHLRVAQCTHNTVLVRLLNSFYQLTLKRRKSFFADRKRARESAADHKELLEAIERRDGTAANALVRGHMERARLYWSEVLDSAVLAEHGAPRANRRH
jgi:GntR family transcriptional repressor for pyruvate dehydrogenase complex